MIHLSLRTLDKAWPIILANATVPLLGLVDTAVMGRFGTTAELGALAISNLVFNLLYWSFGFLRMSTTGFVAQACGVQDQAEIRATFFRAGSVALLLGTLLVLSQVWLAGAAFALLQASAAVESGAEAYFTVRIWGAPATMLMFVLTGVLIGQGRTRTLLVVQLVLNGLNILLDIALVAVAGLGIAGVALGTLITEWVLALGVAGAMIWHFRRSRSAGKLFEWSRIMQKQPLLRTLSANRDLFVRTLFLLLGFAWFTNQAASYDDRFLAATHILLGFISFSAFFLDGFAFVAEAEVGKALGVRDLRGFRAAVRDTSAWALLTALLLAGVLMVSGNFLLSLMTDLPSVRDAAQHFLPWACVYIACSVAAFQLDGIFIGMTYGRALRNASVAAFFAFLGVQTALETRLGQSALWPAFVFFVICRAVCLSLYYKTIPALFRSSGG